MTTASPLLACRFRARIHFRAVRRLGVLLVAVSLVSLFSASARAAVSSHNAVPMCSSDGRSVIAPPIVLPWRVLKLEAPPPCPQGNDTLFQSALEHHPAAPSQAPAPEAPRAVPVRGGELARPARTRVLVSALAPPPSRELLDTLYRPPRH
jgi:hypothetical protein